MYSENDTLYCEKGTYDTNKEISQLYNNALISNVDMVLNADTIYYLKPTKYGKARGTVKILDRKNETKLYGSFAEMIGSRGQFTITKDAVVKKYMDRDSMYIVCDTIQYFNETDIQEEMVRCYHKVNIFKSDLQAICDSLVYIKNDSIIYLYTQPVVWSGVNQITSDTILLFINNNLLDSFKLRSNGFLISREGSKEFNQLVGRNMYGSFKDSKISYMFASGNAQSIYYAKDDDSAYMGVNVITCSEMEFMFEDNKISRANFITKPDAIFHPLNVLKSEELRLKGFKWKERIRPKQNKILPLLRVKYSDL
jgi:lipopolysaccharide export system protein LptA